MENLSFKISSGLKNIIGRELITNKTIAIFELVKNSYDAGAKNVNISFNNIYLENASIIISDDGCGMNKSDLINKWLFVAYSEKKQIRTTGYINSLNKNRTYAGAKGVGRFSCDRLGNKLKLYSKKQNDDFANILEINWDDFEQDAKEEFANVSVKYDHIPHMPNNNMCGTSIVIEGLREKWSRQDILELKKSLAKLVNPYEQDKDAFYIYLQCDDEIENDQKQKSDRNIVNGKLKNYIFETLNLKTTQISVRISDDGKEISTEMHDRGIFLFKIFQKSKFRYLKDINIELFYLNRAAKINFRKSMGVAPVEFGSIFVYKNGFRIMPYGEPGADIFNIDRRKAQGYNRYLGTRDLMGRIIILGDNPNFIETSSRDGGFIRTKAFDELYDFYIKFAHIPLEKYVVNLIRWGDESASGESAISPIDIKDKILKYITDYEKKGELISASINDSLFSIIEKNKDKLDSNVITEFKSIANKYQDEKLDKIIQKVEKQNKKFHEEHLELSKQIDKTEKLLETAQNELNVTKRQAIFLKGLTNPKYENATEALHMMNTYAKSIKLNIKKIIKEINNSADKSLIDTTQKYLYEILKAIQKINGTYTFAFSADYDIKKQNQVVNIYDFITDYIDNALFAKTGEFIKTHIEATQENYQAEINPLEFSMIIENIIYNSFKANAKNLYINIYGNCNDIFIVFKDDGVGLSVKIQDSNRIFELGYTTTNGTGVGLAYAKRTIKKWGGDIFLPDTQKDGFSIIVRLKDEH